MFPTKVLLATDGLAEASLAEEAAVELSGSTGSELHVVHVVSTVPDFLYPQHAMDEQREILLERRKLDGVKLLDDRVARIEDLGGSVAASHYREGNPEKEIVSLSEKLCVGLIVTGGRRRPRFERIFGIGLSERLSRRSNCPVLVVGGRGSRNSTVPK